jgi:hypothetical protein
MRVQSYFHLLLLSTAGLALVAPVSGDEAADEKARSAEVAALALSEAGSYHLARDGDDGKVSLLPDPVFQWTNPVNGIVHGRLMLWTANGRPEAIVGVYKWYHPFKHRTNEFVSLSTSTFAAIRDGQVAWNPRRAGVEFKPISDAPAPASTPLARLRQMRDLAKDFTGRETTREDVVRELRLLTQPIHRYDAASSDVIDGALFVIAQGTDPEAFLMIEARKSDGAVRWQYALARMNSIALRVDHKGREVWSLPTLAWPTVYTRSEPYTTYRFDPKTP